MSAEVPPISTVIRLLRPHRMPSARPPITPPAGPDIRMPTAFCEHVSTRGDAAIRLDHPQVGAKAVFGEPILQVVEIERGFRTDEGVHRRG